MFPSIIFAINSPINIGSAIEILTFLEAEYLEISAFKKWKISAYPARLLLGELYPESGSSSKKSIFNNDLRA